MHDTTTRTRRWSLRRRTRTPSPTPVTQVDPVERLIDVRAHPGRDAARTVLPLLSGVADRLRSSYESTRDPELRHELQLSLSRLEALIQDVWTRAVCEPEVEAAGQTTTEPAAAPSVAATPQRDGSAAI